MDVFSPRITWTWDQGDLLCFLLRDKKWGWISDFFRNIFPKLTNSICNAVWAKLFCSGILRFKYIKFSQIIGIFSGVKDVTHDIRRQAIQVFMSLNHKEFYAFLLDWFFICVLKKYFEIRGVVLLNKVPASFMYAVNSTNRLLYAKHT